MSTTPTPYKPSPLSFNSPRASPFRRANSPLAPSPSTVRPSTPTSSPLKPTDTPTPSQTPLRNTTTSNASANPPPWLSTRGTSMSNTASLAAKFDGAASSNTPPPAEPPSLSFPAPIPFAPIPAPLSISKPAPSRAPDPTPALAPRPMTLQRTTSSDAFSKIPPPLLHSMRESFSVMDRDNDGHVNSADVADMLSQLGLSATPSALSTYFNGAQSINLATYLSTLSDLLSPLSRTSELSAAFEAFDDGDDGQIDLAELKDALMHTAPEPGERKLTEREIDTVVEGFSGRRAFGKGGKGLGRGEVFRYEEFVASITGGGNAGENGTAGAAAPV